MNKWEENNMKNRKIISGMLCILMTTAVFSAGCGSSGATGNTAASDAPSAPASTGMTDTGETSSASSAADGTQLSGNLNIWAWGADDEAKSRDAVIQTFITEHPELKVDYTIIPTANSTWDQKASAALSSGSAGDVMQMSPDYYGMNTDYYMDLRPFIEKEGINLDDVLVPGVIDGYYDQDGKLEGFPLLANCFVMAYNKDMFDAAGVEYPKEGWTMEDLADWGTKFAKGSGADQTYAIVKHWVMNNIMLYAEGGTPYSDDLKTSNMGSDNIVKSLELYNRLISSGVMPDDTAQDTIPAETLFVSGKAAMYPCGGFEAITVTKDAQENGINIGFAPMPCDPAGNEINIQYATGWAITNTCKNPDAAWEFLKECAYANEDMLKQTAIIGMPAGKDVADNYYSTLTYEGNNLDNSYYVEHMGKTHLNPFGGTLTSSGDIWTTMVEAVTMDGQDPQAVVDQYAPQIEKEFAGYKFNNKQ